MAAILPKWRVIGLVTFPGGETSTFVWGVRAANAGGARYRAEHELPQTVYTDGVITVQDIEEMPEPPPASDLPLIDQPKES